MKRNLLMNLDLQKIVPDPEIQADIQKYLNNLQEVKKTDKVKVRQAQPEDADFVFHVLETAMSGYLAKTTGWEKDKAYREHQQQFNPEGCRIIENSSQPIGAFKVTDRDTHLVLDFFYLLPGHQSMGIGTTLMKKVLAMATSHERKIRTRILKANGGAIHFFEQLGFRAQEEEGPHLVYEA